MKNDEPFSYADKEFFYLSYMTDRFGWTSDDWDALSPEARGNLIANLNHWVGKREREREEAEKRRKESEG